MDKISFIELLQRSSPNEVRDYIARKGKLKLVNPIIEIDEIEPSNKTDTNKKHFKNAEVVK